MLVDIVIPELGESITEGTITGWLVEPGARIEEDQPLLQLDTDKVSVDVPAPASGVLRERLFEAGDDVQVGAVIGRIDTEAADEADAAEDAAPKAEAGGVEAGRAQAETTGAKAKAGGAEPKAKAASGAEPGAEAAPTGGNGHPGAMSPSVRRLVREHDIDAQRLEGTGPHGRVRPEDVAQYLEGREAPPRQARGEVPAPEPRGAPPPAEATERPERRIPMTRLRRRIAERLKEVQDTAAILTTFNEVDMTEVMALRRRYKAPFEKAHGVKLGVMSFFVKAAIEALKAHPAVNAAIEGDAIVYHDYYDVGVAVSTERGLVVPVVRDADRLSFADVEKSIGELARAARDGSLTLDQLSGGTFSITNGGVFGSMLSTPILNPPQSGILGMHAILERPMAIDGRVEIRPMMYLALSYDHRLVDGAEAVQFLVKIKDTLEDPGRLLLEI